MAERKSGRPKRQRRPVNPLFAAAAAGRTQKNAAAAENRMKASRLSTGQLAKVGQRAISRAKFLKERRRQRKKDTI